MPLIKHDTPAGLRDLPEGSQFYEAWHQYIAGKLDMFTEGADKVGEFYDASEVDVDPIGYRSLVWMAFPREALMKHRDNRRDAYAEADADAGRLDVQNEYCEWRVTRKGDKITKVTFVTETPEYWEELWKADKSCVVNLYQKLVSSDVKEIHLMTDGGKYYRTNPWNSTGGIVHLTHEINTLNDALGVAQGGAKSKAEDAAKPKAEDNYEAEVGTLHTSVDPRVPRDVGTLVRKGLSVTLRGPIGIYIAGWDDTGWTKPDGTPVGNYWRIVRGSPGQVLRLDYEVPASEGFAVGDIRIGGRPIKWGGQIAEHISVSVVGLAGKRHVGPLAWLGKLVGVTVDRRERRNEQVSEGKSRGRREA